MSSEGYSNVKFCSSIKGSSILGKGFGWVLVVNLILLLDIFHFIKMTIQKAFFPQTRT